MVRAFYLTLAAVLVFVLAGESQAVLVQTQIFSETFDTNTADLASTTATYPAFSSEAGTGSINVVGNQLQIVRGSNNYFLTNQDFNEEIWVTVDMGGTHGSTDTAGQYATALVIGNRAFQFFPGCCGGALRTYDFNPATGAIGANLTSPNDITMPFTPAETTMHHIVLHSDNAGGLDLTFIDGNNPLNIYTQGYNIAGFIPGKVGFSSFHNVNTSTFDNLTISALREEIVPAPEPTSAALLGLGGLVLMSVSSAKRRKRDELNVALNGKS